MPSSPRSCASSRPGGRRSRSRSPCGSAAKNSPTSASAGWTEQRRASMRRSPFGLAFLQERVHALDGIRQLACRGHDLDGVRVRLGLVEIHLRIKRLLAERLALRAAPGDPFDQIRNGAVELRVGHDPVDQPPLGCGGRVDGIARKCHLHGPLPPDSAGDCHRRCVAEPSALAAGQCKPRGLCCHREVGTGDQLAARRSGQRVHSRDDGLRDLLEERHKPGARHQQLAHRSMIMVHDVGEVMPGGEHRPVGGKYDAQCVTPPGLGERVDQLAHELRG